MRVLALAHRYLPEYCAGAEAMLHGMLRALAVRGHTVDVSLSQQHGEPYVADGINVWPYVTKTDVFEHLRRGVDIVVAHLENSPRAAALGHWNDVPVVIVNHNTFAPSKQVLTTPTGKVDLVVANSRWMADDLERWLESQRKRAKHLPKVIVHRPTVNPADYATTPGDRVTLVNLRVDEQGPHDTLPMGKGGNLFRALAERMPETLFLGVTGAYGTQRDMTGLPNVEVLEHIPNSQMRERVYARTRVLLMPSSYESWGRVGTEAMCSGIPVVAHPTPGLLESLGGAGIFVDRDDVAGWIAVLRDLENSDAYEAASKRALARADELQRMHADDEALWVSEVERLGTKGIL